MIIQRVIANEGRVKQSICNTLQIDCFSPHNDHSDNLTHSKSLPRKSLGKCIFLVLFFTLPLLSYSQKKLEIIHAGSLKFDENLGNGAKRLIGDVQFKHEDVLMFCDSAYFYSDNSLDAFGHIHIVQNDSIHLYGDFLKYSGNTKKAVISKNVIVNKGDMQLTTDVLNYDIATSVGFYTNTARIVNKENELVSKQGYFFAKTNELNFKKDVVLTNQKAGQTKPQFVINCDTMRYNTSSKITSFAGPTTIKSYKNLIYCEDGWYDTKKDLSRFSKNAYILTEEQKMFGDSLYYDRINGIGKAIKNVQIIDTTQHLNIKGDYAIHYELKDLSIVTGHTLLTQISGPDTLYLHADTLKALGDNKQEVEGRRQKTEVVTSSKSKNKKEDEKKEIRKKGKSKKVEEPIQKLEEKNKNNEIKNERLIAPTSDSIVQKKEIRNQQLFAYHKVKFFKNDLQGKCDSLVYSTVDSTMRMFGSPTIWSDGNQLTSDSLQLIIGDSSLKSIELKGSAFIVSKEDSLRFNQIRGKYMKGFFKKNELYLINVEGNGQTIYYAKDKDVVKAVNRADCSDLKIYLKNKTIDRINFITKPEATLYPLNKIDINELKLKDFSWREQFRPHKIEDIFIW